MSVQVTCSLSLHAALWDDLVAANQEGTELFAHQDMKGLVSHYTADATLMFPGLDVIQGRDGEGVS